MSHHVEWKSTWYAELEISFQLLCETSDRVGLLNEVFEALNKHVNGLAEHKFPPPKTVLKIRPWPQQRTYDSLNHYQGISFRLEGGDFQAVHDPT